MNNNERNCESYLDAIEILIDSKLKNVARIDKCVCKEIVDTNKCMVELNGKINKVIFYGSQPSLNSIYPIFIPGNNMSVAFIIVA